MASAVPPPAAKHNNNFTFLRFVAASMVIVAHAYELQNIPGVEDPLERLIGRTMGWAGVAIFFVMSGYLIMSSLQRSTDLGRFAVARALRIFPGLAVCMIGSVVLLGLFASTEPAAAFFTDGLTFKYLFGNISLLSIQHHLPGVFESNPLTRAVNGSIWTLPFEVGCYIMAVALVSLGLKKPKRAPVMFALLFAGCLGFLVIEPMIAHYGFVIRLSVMQKLVSCFLFGMAYASFADRIVLRWWYPLPVAVLAWLLSGTAFYEFVLSLAMALFVLWIAFVPSPLLLKLSRAPDYSYGIYIYAFPIQQVLMMTVPTLPPLLHALIAFLLVLIPASLSWHFVEKPALRLKDHLIFRRLAKPIAVGGPTKAADRL